MFLLLLCLSLLSAPTQVAAQSSVTLADYWSRAAETRAVLAAAQGSGDEDGLAAEAAWWTATQSITLPNGERVAVDHSYLVYRLTGDEKLWPEALSYLDNLLAAYGPGQAASGGPAFDGAEAELRTVLTAPEFRYDAALTLRERFWLWLGDLFGRLLGAPGNRTLAGVAYLGAAIALVVALALGGAYASRLFSRDRPAATEIQGPPMTADAALTAAQKESAAGDYRAGVRFLYLALLLHLDEHGRIHYDRSLTNREYLQQLQNRPEAGQLLRDVVDVFDRVWYGFEPLSADAYGRFEQQVAALRGRA